MLDKSKIKNLVIGTSAFLSVPVIYGIGTNLCRKYHSGPVFFGTMVLAIGVPKTIIKVKEKCDNKKNKEE